MDITQPIFHGITLELSRILGTLSLDTFNAPIWSLRQTESRIYLDLAWSKQSHVPAQTRDKGTNAKDMPAKQTATKALKTPSYVSSTVPTDSTKVQKSHKKRKSPSTRRRDKLRFQAWVARKNQQPQTGTSNMSKDPSGKPSTRNLPPTEHYSSQETPNSTQEEHPSPNPAPKAQAPEQEPVEQNLHSSQDRTAPSSDTCSTCSNDTNCSHSDTKITYAERDVESDDNGEVQAQEMSISQAIDCYHEMPIQQRLKVVQKLVPFPKDACRHCDFIGDAKSFKRCSKCRFVQYCSRECQVSHWKQDHKNICAEDLIEKFFLVWDPYGFPEQEDLLHAIKDTIMTSQ